MLPAQSISPIRVNMWGGSGGGPVWIPKLYDGRRKKTFFFFTYAGIRNLQPSDTGFLSLPTAQERNGDFSGSYSVVSGKYYATQLFNPYSTTTGTRQPYSFAGCTHGSQLTLGSSTSPPVTPAPANRSLGPWMRLRRTISSFFRCLIARLTMRLPTTATTILSRGSRTINFTASLCVWTKPRK